MDTAPSSWFKHSSDSLSEPDIKRVKQRFGKLQGYAMYYITIELMVKNGGSIRDTDLDLFCEDYALTVDEIQEFFSFCTGAGIFVLSDAGYTCDLAQFTIERRAHIRSIKSEAGKKSAQLRQADPGPAPKPKKRSAKHDPDTPESDAVKAMIEDIEAEIGAHPISNLSNEEMTKLAVKYDELLPKMLRNYYLWKVSKNKKVKSDYLSILKPWVEESVKSKFGTNASAAKQMSRIEQINNVTDFIGKEMT